MTLFISWAGDTALKAARILADWIPRVLPFIPSPWISPRIEAGKVGVQAIMDALSQADAGLVVLTPESQHSQWLAFEAGALAGRERFIPVLLGLAPAEHIQPFTHFQFRQATRTGMPHVLADLMRIAAAVDPATSTSQLDLMSRSQQLWPELRDALMPLATASRQMSRELQMGPAARYVNQAERQASEQRLRAEQQEYRANAYKSLVELFLRYERAIDNMDPNAVVGHLRREIQIVRQIVSTEDFGDIAEGHFPMTDYRIDD